MVSRKKNKKVVKHLIAWVVIIVLIAWVWSRWDIWFSNPPEPEYHSLQYPSRIVTTCTSAHNRIFSWVYGETPVKGELEIVLSEGGDTVKVEANSTLYQSRSGKLVYYHAEIDNLKPASEYCYRVLHPQDTTTWKTFKTYPDRKEIQFIFIGDIQDNVARISQSFFQEIDSLHPDVSLYLLGGDAIHRPMNICWDEWYSSMAHIAEKTPILATAGNHEYLKGLPPRLDERFYFTFPIYDRENSGDNACAYIEMGDVAFFILDSNKEFWTYPAQRNWLKSKMKHSNAKWKVVALHHPIYSVRGALNNILQRMAFNGVIKECGATLVLQGHEHAYMRKATVDGSKQTVPIYITSNSSPKNYCIEFTGDGQRYGGGDRYYQCIKASGDTLSIATYNSTHQLYDKIVVTDSCGKKVVEVVDVEYPETIVIAPDIAPKKVEKYQRDIDLYFSSKEKRNGEN